MAGSDRFVTIRLSAELFAALKELSLSSGITLQKLCSEAILALLKKHGGSL